MFPLFHVIATFSINSKSFWYFLNTPFNLAYNIKKGVIIRWIQVGCSAWKLPSKLFLRNQKNELYANTQPSKLHVWLVKTILCEGVIMTTKECLPTKLRRYYRVNWWSCHSKRLLSMFCMLVPFSYNLVCLCISFLSYVDEFTNLLCLFFLNALILPVFVVITSHIKYVAYTELTI